MGKRSLQGGTISHDGIGQIGQILFPEEGEGDLPELLSQRDPPYTAFYIGCQIGGIILKSGDDKDQNQAYSSPCQIKEDPAVAYATGHHVKHKPV